MNSITEDRIGTLIKVNQFAVDNATALSSNSNIEDERVILEEDTENVFENDSIATRPLDGFTKMKTKARLNLEGKVLLVRAGCMGYFTLNSDPGKLGIVTFPDSDLTRMKDSELYVKADQVFDIANPVKALLAPFQVVEADVEAIPTLKLAYKNVLQLPRTEQGVSIASGEERDRLVEKSLNQTLVRLDAYLLPFRYTNPMLYSKYETARAIDNSGGGSDSTGYETKNFALAPGATLSFGDTVAPDKEIYIRQIGGTAGVVVCEAALDTDACASGYTLTPGTTVKKPYGDLGLSGGAVINFTNPGSETVTVRAGLKI